MKLNKKQQNLTRNNKMKKKKRKRKTFQRDKNKNSHYIMYIINEIESMEMAFDKVRHESDIRTQHILNADQSQVYARPCKNKNGKTLKRHKNNKNKTKQTWINLLCNL